MLGPHALPSSAPQDRVRDELRFCLGGAAEGRIVKHGQILVDGAAGYISGGKPCAPSDANLFRLRWNIACKRVFQLRSETVEIAVDYRRDVEGQRLRHHEATNDGKPERLASGAALAQSERNGEASHESGHCRHHNRAEAD